MAQKFDLAVVGGGPGGYVAAIRAAQLGKSVVLVESEHLGGICLNWGCIPTKAMLKSAEVFYTMKHAKEYGLILKDINFDLEAIVNRSRNIASQLSTGVTHLLKKNKVTVVSGKAKIEDQRTLIVNEDKKQNISFENLIIATGSRAKEMKGLETDGTLVWNYKHALIPKKIPETLLVVGSGAIGVEFASFYNSLGVDTTLIEIAERILPNEDDEISAEAKKEFINRGIKVLDNTSLTKIAKNEQTVEVTLKTLENIETHEFDTIITAIGIIGNVENLGLEVVGIDVVDGHIVTDDFCRTSAPNIFAIGDVTGPPWLAHKASHEGILVSEFIAEKQVSALDTNNIAGCTYCSPQIASVGLTEKQAVDRGFAVNVGKFPYVANGKALAIGESNGFIKTVFDKRTGELLGAHMIGAEVTELIHSFSLGKRLEITQRDLSEAIFPHPTLSEMLHESTLSSLGRAIHY